MALGASWGFLGFPGASGVKWSGAQNHRFQFKKTQRWYGPLRPGALWRGGPSSSPEPAPSTPLAKKLLALRWGPYWFLGWGAKGPRALGPGRLAAPPSGALGLEALGAWFLGQRPLTQRARDPEARAYAREALPLARGALGLGGPWLRGPCFGVAPKSIKNRIEQPARTPSPASWSESSYRGQGAPGGGGGPQTKTLNHVQKQRVTVWGYTLATLKVVWVPAIP